MLDRKRNVSLSNISILNDFTNQSHLEHFEYYIKILQQNFLVSQFYKLVCLAPLILGENAEIDSFINLAKSVLIPLNKTLFDTFERPIYKEHWITDGTTTYFVYKNKYGPGGYVWVDGKAVSEFVLLSAGFKRIHEDPN